MAASESLNPVRTRIGIQLAKIETRSARRKPVDIGSRMAAIRARAAQHGLTAPSAN